MYHNAECWTWDEIPRHERRRIKAMMLGAGIHHPKVEDDGLIHIAIEHDDSDEEER